jgi:protease-4
MHSPDLLADRQHLKKDIKRWRGLAILFLVVALIGFTVGPDVSGVPSARGYIARITVEDIIGDNLKREEMLKELSENGNVKAVLVRMDSPGGTALGGEELYRGLAQLSATKPTVAVMRTACTSACYMAALGTTHLMARDTTITGSIGVLLESAEVTELAKKLGIAPITIKSGKFKATPSFTEKLSEEDREYVQTVVNETFLFFLKLVTQRRDLSAETVNLVADGRIFTGKQAYDLKLIDGLGGEQDAVSWLETSKKIPKKLPIRDIEPQKEPEEWFSQLEQRAKGWIFGKSTVGLDGMLSIWQPSVK